ncbi:MAG: hypothetical protein ACUVRH_07335, partial [Candidatus Bipolaricaulia bacterium]
MKIVLLPVLLSFLIFTPVYSALANEPPQASFTYFPAQPDTLDVVQFIDTSSDPDGAIISW